MVRRSPSGHRLPPAGLLVLLAASVAVVVLGSRENKPEETSNSIRLEQDELSVSAASVPPDAGYSDAFNTTDSRNVTNDWSQKWPYFYTGCDEWLPINHIYFQLANCFLFLSYLAPAGIYGLLYLRLMLAIGCAFFALWGWIVLCAFDTFVWNAFFTVINIVHGSVLLCSLRPVRFDKQVEEVYKTIFQPLKVSKQQFKKVVGCMKAIRPLKRGDYFAVEKDTKVENLSLLLSGSMLVIENGKALNVLGPMQFLDSPEWFFDDVDYFQVSIRSCEESRVLLWHRDKLKLILLSDAFLSAVFDHILGRDVVRKMTQMREKIGKVASPGSGATAFRANFNGSFGTNADKPMSTGSAKGSTVHEHGALAAPEQMSLLDETKSKGNLKPSTSKKKGASSSKPAGSSASRQDYSAVQHLDSTDI